MSRAVVSGVIGWITACGRRVAVCAFAILMLCAGVCTGQQNPVFVDDAPGAAEAIRSATGHAGSGNLDTAVRVVQGLLETSAEKLMASEDDELLMVTVRDRVHGVLLGDARLLERYRRLESARAERLLEAGEIERVERELFLTEAGREAGLRLAQLHLERARFDAALRLLEAVDGHPDQRGVDDGAVDLAGLLAVYLPEAAGLAESWARSAGRGFVPGERVGGPEIVTARGAFDPAPAVDFEEIVPSPIRSRPFAEGADGVSGLLGLTPTVARTRGGARVQVVPARMVSPALAGDVLIVCDGAGVTGLDRFTLEERWRVETGAPRARGNGIARSSASAGPLTVGVWGRTVVAATAAAHARQNLGDGRVHGIDIETGELRWSVVPGELSEELEGAEPTGAVVVSDGIAVVPVVRHVREQRLASASLVALRVSDGALVWTRVVASAGVLPQNILQGPGATPVIEDGVVYYTEPLGTVSAVELATGRFVWARRSVSTERVGTGARLLWPSRPVLRGETLYALEPAGRRVVALDTGTGALVAARDETDFSSPGLLVEAGGWLVAVSQRDVRSVAFGDFADLDVTPERVYGVDEGQLEGHPVVVGEQLFLPDGDGFTLVDPAVPGEVVLRLDFGNTGNVLVAPGQLVAIEGTGVSSYLVWEQARDALTARMEKRPGDAAPAVTLAELAHRAGRPEAIVPAIDAALESLRASGSSARASATRRRLFVSIDAMVSKVSAEYTPDDAVLSALIARLGQAASEPAEAALHQLRSGAFAEATGRAGDAVAAYQRVLDDASLRDSEVVVAERSEVAMSVCTRRLRRLVAAEGAALYAVFEREARSALERAVAAGDPGRLVELARRYPVAEASLEAWVAASDASLSRGRLRGSIAALEEALVAAEGIPTASDEIVGEIVGRLATRLVEGGRPAAASSVLARTAQARPGLVLTNRGALVDLDSLRQQIAMTRTQAPRRATIGLIGEEPALTTIAGLLPLRPLFSSLDSDHSLALLAGEDVFEAWEVVPEGGLVRRWSAPLDPAMSLLRVDSTGAVVSLGFDEEQRLARINARTGETVWETPAFSLSFAEGSEPGLGETVVLPAGAVRPMGELLVALRDDTAALIERSGRAAGYDIAEGRELWARELGVDQVYDAAESGGLLVVVGARDAADRAGRLALEAVGVVVDLSTGRTTAEIDFGGARPRWVRASRDGVAVIGADRGIFGIDLGTGERLWFAGDAAARRTVEAWGFPGRVILLDSAGQLWQIEIESGEIGRAPLDTRERLKGDAEEIEAAAAGDAAVLSLPRGLVMYDRRGALVGVDHRQSLTTVGPVVFAEEVAVVLEPKGFEPRLYEIRVIELETGRLLESKLLELPARPHSLDLVDGRVLIGAGSGVVVVDADG